MVHSCLHNVFPFHVSNEDTKQGYRDFNGTILTVSEIQIVCARLLLTSLACLLTTMTDGDGGM